MSPLMSGTRAFVVQRVSAIYMALFIPLFLIVLAWHQPLDYTGWRSLVGIPALSMGLTLFFLVLLLHAWVGIRDVILDYLGRRPGARLLVLSLLALWLVGQGLWLLRALLPVVAP